MADKTITIPKMQHAVLTAGGYTDVEIDDDPEFVEDNFGLTLTSLPSNTQVLVEVQLFLINARNILPWLKPAKWFPWPRPRQSGLSGHRSKREIFGKVAFQKPKS